MPTHGKCGPPVVTKTLTQQADVLVTAAPLSRLCGCRGAKESDQAMSGIE